MTEEQGKYEVAIANKNESIFLSMDRFEFAKKVASMLASSTMVPDQFQGQQGVGNCMIMLNLAERLGVDVFGLMQTSYVVHKRPGFEAKLIIALFSTQTKLFIPPIRWEMKGDFPRGKDAKCRAYAKDRETGEYLYGEWIDWELIRAEGWDKDKGSMKSKWMTMPGQMFRYRSASFFINAYEPGLKLGIHTVDEIEDSIIDVTPQPKKHAHDELPVPGPPNVEIKPDPIPNTEAAGESPIQEDHGSSELSPGQEFWDKAGGLRAGYEATVMGHIEKIRSFAPEIQELLRGKWLSNAGTKGKPWPLDDANQNGSVDEDAQEEKASPDDFVICPDTLETEKRANCIFCDKHDQCEEMKDHHAN